MRLVGVSGLLTSHTHPGSPAGVDQALTVVPTALSSTFALCGHRVSTSAPPVADAMAFLSILNTSPVDVILAGNHSCLPRFTSSCQAVEEERGPDLLPACPVVRNPTSAF